MVLFKKVCLDIDYIILLLMHKYNKSIPTVISMASGLKKRIMVSCVTFETTKVTDPVDYYEANKLHIIHYVSTNSNKPIYASFYERVLNIISESGRKVEIVEHNEKVYDFSIMLKTVLHIIQTERKENPECDIYVNISAGSPEYAAASAIASMMVPGTIPFTVRTDSFTVPEDKIKETYFIDGEPVGLTKTTRGTEVLPCYSISMPDESLVRGLRLIEKVEGKPIGRKVIAALKESGIWYRNIPENENSNKSEAVYYQRDFVNKWLELGWIVKNKRTGWYEITDDGRKVMNTFYLDDSDAL